MKKRQEKLAHTRKRGRVQRSFVQARQIHDHLLCLSSGFVNVLAVEGISYDLKSPDEQLLLNEQFQHLLAGLCYPVQILWRVLPVNLGEYLDQFTFLAERGAEAEGIWPLICSSHATFLHRLAERRTLLNRTIYLILQVNGKGKPQSRAQRLFSKKRRQQWAEQREQARQDLDLRSSELMRQLADMNLFVKRLRGEQELAPFYYSCLTPAKADRFPLPPTVIEALDRPIRAPHLARLSSARTPAMEQQDMALALTGRSSLLPAAPAMEQQDTALVVAGPSMPVRPEPPRGFSQLADLVAPAAITVLPDCLQVEQDYSRTLLVHHLPRLVHAGWLKPLADLDEPMEVSFHLHPESSASMIQQLRRQHRAYHSSQIMAQHKGTDADPATKIAGDDVSDLLPRLASGEERMLTVSMLVQVRAPSKRLLNERTARIAAVLHAMLLVAHTALFEQEQAFRSCLPHGQCELAGMLLDSRSCSTLFPFLSNTLFHPQGVLEGVTPQGDLVVLDPWAEGMANANRLILGPPGGGKSHGVKGTLIRHLLKVICSQLLRLQLIVIDPDSEYSHMCTLFGGQTIRLAPGSAHHLNPFDLPRRREGDLRAGHEDLLAEHVHRLHTLFEIMLANRTTSGMKELSAEEHSLLDAAIYEMYRRVGITNDRRTHDRPAPLMRDLYLLLKHEKEKDAHYDPSGLLGRFDRFVNGSLSGLFAGPTTISLDRVMIDFDIKELETELRPIGIFLISNFVWTESYHAKIPRLLIVDEAATLMDYASGKKFLEELVRRIRKWNGGVWVIAQNPLIFLDTSIPANCATHVLMRQSEATLDVIRQMFHLSSRELQLLRRLPIGEALLLTSEKRLHIRFEASEVEHLLATTNQHERDTWRERSGNDEAFDQLLHRLGLDHVQNDAQETSITAKLPVLKEELTAVSSDHQSMEGER